MSNLKSWSHSGTSSFLAVLKPILLPLTGCHIIYNWFQSTIALLLRVNPEHCMKPLCWASWKMDDWPLIRYSFTCTKWLWFLVSHSCKHNTGWNAICIISASLAFLWNLVWRRKSQQQYWYCFWWWRWRIFLIAFLQVVSAVMDKKGLQQGAEGPVKESFRALVIEKFVERATPANLPVPAPPVHPKITVRLSFWKLSIHLNFIRHHSSRCTRPARKPTYTYSSLFLIPSTEGDEPCSLSIRQGLFGCFGHCLELVKPPWGIPLWQRLLYTHQ